MATRHLLACCLPLLRGGDSLLFLRLQLLKVRNLKGEAGRERVLTHDEEFAYLSAAPAFLGESGADAYEICKLMGHSNIQISARYVHPTPERIELAFASLDAYNEERRAAAEEKAEQEAATFETLVQTA